MSVPSWVNPQTIIGLAIFVVALVAGQSAMRSADTTTLVWSAGRDLPSGTRLSPDDLRAVDARLAPSTSGSYFESSQDLAGTFLTQAVTSGELIPVSKVSSSAPQRSAIAIPITSDHAVGGELNPGDYVDVYATFGASQGNPRTVLVLRAEVLDVAAEPGFSGGATFSGVTIAVPPEEAARVAFVIRTAELDLVRIDGSHMNIDQTGEVRRRDFGQ